ncbi:hypothetical protein PFISCL1PPCAC_7507 [Pristionchus fissidentatus]|uniref:Uncharacterized protein n=1 Tax=Pristionchus fissidentatus TaxID=1538716 RepID=A0AAV5VCD9_9BILA|nr:hypothetical protein PFISCL1PPCAC_7507 [Pristionchus fissidentatus]
MTMDIFILHMRYSTKRDFDATPSGANGRSMCKINMFIVISTLDNVKSQSFRKLTFFHCANPC